MTFPLVSHVNRDDDVIEAWLRHYLALGVGVFHLIVHGGREQNQTLFTLLDRYPIRILDAYTGPFDPYEKRDRLMRALLSLDPGWVVLVDSDEFLELPYRSLATTVGVMQWLKADSLQAPMLQRFAADGAVHGDGGARLSDTYSWCSVDLYARMGQPQAVIDKYPLFLRQRRTWLKSGGNHYPPNGHGSRLAPMLGVTHHFKWRPAVEQRMSERARSAHPFRGESAQYINYLEQSAWRLPTDGAFRYSRPALFARGLLRRPSLIDFALRRARIVVSSNGRRDVDVLMSPDRLATHMAQRGFTSVALCGTGSGGQLFLNALRDKQVNVTCVVDRDHARWGTLFEGLSVCALDQAFQAGERTFVAGSLVYGAEIKERIETRARQLGLDVTVFATVRAPEAASSQIAVGDAR